MSRTSGRSTRFVRVLAVVAAGALVAAGCSADEPDASPAPEPEAPADTQAVDNSVPSAEVENAPSDIVGTALEAGVFTDLAGYLIDADLVQALRGGPFTVFAPTNDAFLKIPLDTRRAVAADIDTLTTVLLYHVVEGVYTAADLEEGELMTLAGIPLEITKDGDTVLVNGFPVAAADVEASNGVIHVMGDVLIPPS
jgi:uncharacterized surface protein with fasciclin (FAS1) repeats